MSALEAPSLDLKEYSTEKTLSTIRKVIVDNLGISDSLVSDSDCIAVARVSEIVGTRGCRLSACALAAVVKQTGNDQTENKVKFGLDGSLVEFYPRFQERVRQAVRELLGEQVEKRVQIDLARDGSGVGGEFQGIAIFSIYSKMRD